VLTGDVPKAIHEVEAMCAAATDAKG